MKFLELLDQATVIVPVYRNHLSVEKHFDLCLFVMFRYNDVSSSERPEVSDNEKRIRPSFNTHSA